MKDITFIVMNKKYKEMRRFENKNQYYSMSNLTEYMHRLMRTIMDKSINEAKIETIKQEKWSIFM